MKIEIFTETDIKEAARLAYPVWGEGHAANGQGERFGLLLCEYIIRYVLSSVPGCGKLLLAEVVSLAREKSYESLYLWSDASCNHGYYAHHGFEKVDEFKSGEWATDTADYLTYIYRKLI